MSTLNTEIRASDSTPQSNTRTATAAPSSVTRGSALGIVIVQSVKARPRNQASAGGCNIGR